LWISKWLAKDFFSETLDDYKDLPTTEHNLDVIRCSDWIIDLVPEAGDMGRQNVVTGTPEEVPVHTTSHTGRYFKQGFPGIRLNQQRCHY